MNNISNKAISLAGEWFVYTGTKECSSDVVSEIERNSDKVHIPGTLQGEGYGEKVNENTEWIQSLYDRLWYEREEYKFAQEEEVNVPFISQPPSVYRGKAWYYRTFCISSEQDGNWFTLFIECTKWKTTVYLDNAMIGSNTGLCTPHEYDLGILSSGEHKILICVDNGWQLPYRPDGHGVTDALGGGWNGLTGRVELRSSKQVRISSVRVYTSLENKEAEYEITIERSKVSNSRENDRKKFVLRVDDCPEEEIALMPGETRTCSISESLDKSITPWDEFHQSLIKRTVSITENNNILDSLPFEFGIREICVKGDQFYVNGRPTYFRGTHFGGDFPLTGYPDCTSEFWNNIMRTVKEWGLNYIRFHSFCPPEAAFVAADQFGVYLQVECGMWNVFAKDCEMNEVLDLETDRILNSFGNHPSFVMLSPSNEPGGSWEEPLKSWVAKWKAKDNRRLYTAQSGWPYSVPPNEISGTDYAYFHRSGFGIEPGGTIRNAAGWNGKDYRKSLEGIHMPAICHELGQWCSYPDYSIIDKFKGYLRPGNYKVFKESAKKHGVLSQNKEFVYNSGKLQASMYKEEIEANLRTPHLYGFELLDLHDYLGQGTALVGVLDTFWDNKGFIQPEEWRMFCSATVPLVRLEKHVFQSGERVECKAEISHFGEFPIKNAMLKWELFDSTNNSVLAGSPMTMDVPLGKNTNLPDISFNIPESNEAAKFYLRISVLVKDKKIAENEWKLWAYPKKNEVWLGESKRVDEESMLKEPSEVMQLDRKHKVHLTSDWKEAIDRLKDGERVLFSPSTDSLSLRCAPVGFRPVFWNAQMGPTWKRNLGLLIEEKHQAFQSFPTNSYADWQWEALLTDCRGFELEGIYQNVHSLVQVIDEWNRNLRMDLIFETRVGAGSLLVSMIKPVKTDACQTLYQSLLNYMQSDAFSPNCTMNLSDLIDRYSDNHCMEKLQAQCRMIKGDDASGSRYPYTVEITMNKEHSIHGLIYFPRQNNRERAGDIKKYQITDQSGTILSEGSFLSSFEPKEVYFDKTVTTDRIYFTALSGFEGMVLPCWKMKADGWYCKKEAYIEKDDIEPTLYLMSPELSIESADNEEYKKTSKSFDGKESSWNVHTMKSETKEIDI